MTAPPRQPRRRQRRRRAAAGAALALGLGVALALGPRPRLDPRLPQVDLPEDLTALEASIAARERAAPDVDPAMAAGIVWASGPRRRTPLALVYLHGFSASRAETAPLCDRVARAVGANLYYARLTGHGQPGERLGAARAQDWLADAAHALAVGRRLGERVVLVGTSTGGALGTWLAAQPAGADLAALVLLSPNFAVGDPRGAILSWPWGGVVARLIVGPERSWTPHNEQHGRFWTHRYPTRVLPEVAALLDLTACADLGRIRAPLLLIYGPHDRVVDPAAAVRRFADFGSPAKALVPFEGCEDPNQHVLAGDILSPSGTEPLAARITSVLATHVTPPAPR